MKTTVAVAAQNIRTALRALGYTSRQVSVKSSSYSMGSSITVRVLDWRKVDIKAVEGVALAHDEVRRDEYGDILSGGNRYVTVEFDNDALDEAVKALGAGPDMVLFGWEVEREERGFNSGFVAVCHEAYSTSTLRAWGLAGIVGAVLREVPPAARAETMVVH